MHPAPTPGRQSPPSTAPTTRTSEATAATTTGDCSRTLPWAGTAPRRRNRPTLTPGATRWRAPVAPWWCGDLPLPAPAPGTTPYLRRLSGDERTLRGSTRGTWRPGSVPRTRDGSRPTGCARPTGTARMVSCGAGSAADPERPAFPGASGRRCEAAADRSATENTRPDPRTATERCRGSRPWRCRPQEGGRAVDHEVGLWSVRAAIGRTRPRRRPLDGRGR